MGDHIINAVIPGPTYDEWLIDGRVHDLGDPPVASVHFNLLRRRTCSGQAFSCCVRLFLYCSAQLAGKFMLNRTFCINEKAFNQKAGQGGLFVSVRKGQLELVNCLNKSGRKVDRLPWRVGKRAAVLSA